MTSIHQQPMTADYRLHMPHSFQYAFAAGSVAVALGAGYRAVTPAHSIIAKSIIGVGAILLTPTLAFWGGAHVLQSARDHLRDLIAVPANWQGNESVLDVGTGSGVLLLACAKHLRSGSAIGIDIYDPNAGGGSTEQFWHNARAEGIADRVDLLNVDARTMVFPDASFNVIVSSLAMHHMGGVEDRRRATEEMMRVLKPGGKIAICDFSAVLGECKQVLQHGMYTVREHRYKRVFSVLIAEKP